MGFVGKKKNLNPNSLKGGEIAVDTSLLSWLNESEKTSIKENSPPLGIHLQRA